MMYLRRSTAYTGNRLNTYSIERGQRFGGPDSPTTLLRVHKLKDNSVDLRRALGFGIAEFP